MHINQKPLLVDRIDKTGKLCLFWGSTHPFSNWHPSTLLIDGFTYSSGEQRMMHAKACYFNDLTTAERVRQEHSPRELKKLGRSVINYIDSEWEKVRLEMMIELVFSKADQHSNMKKFLLETQSALIVEASPVDPIWGVGLAQSDPAILDPKNWKGTNLLGISWDRARDLFIQGLTPPPSQCSIAINKLYGPVSSTATNGLKF